MESKEKLEHNRVIGLRTVEALKRNGYKAAYFDTSAEARDAVLSMISDNASVGFGGSATVSQLNIHEELQSRGCTLYDHNRSATPEEKLKMRYLEQDADYFLTGTNAVTVDGKLYNMDATGNRVSAMIFGPKHVIAVAGINKVVRDLNEAEERVRTVAAPVNGIRLHRDTPCVRTGMCQDCASPQRLCNIAVVLHHCPPTIDFHVLIIGEELGY